MGELTIGELKLKCEEYPPKQDTAPYFKPPPPLLSTRIRLVGINPEWELSEINTALKNFKFYINDSITFETHSFNSSLKNGNAILYVKGFFRGTPSRTFNILGEDVYLLNLDRPGSVHDEQPPKPQKTTVSPPATSIPTAVPTTSATTAAPTATAAPTTTTTTSSSVRAPAQATASSAAKATATATAPARLTRSKAHLAENHSAPQTPVKKRIGNKQKAKESESEFETGNESELENTVFSKDDDGFTIPRTKKRKERSPTQGPIGAWA